MVIIYIILKTLPEVPKKTHKERDRTIRGSTNIAGIRGGIPKNAWVERRIRMNKENTTNIVHKLHVRIHIIHNFINL